MPAGNGIIGALLVSLGVDTAAFDTGLKQTEGKVGKFGTAVTGLAGAAVAGLVAGLAVAGAAFLKFGTESLGVADDVGDAAARIGVTAEAFQRLDIAATAAGGGPGLMTEAMDKLNENMGAFIQTGGGKAAQAFKDLGIASAITSGQIGTADQAFFAVAKGMEGIEDPALKARISMQLFGKSAGVDMLEVLAPGADALKAFGENAQNTGRIMSNELVQKLADAKLALDNTKVAAGQMATVMAGEAVVAIVDMAKELSPLWEQAKALWSQVAAYLMPSIQDLGKAMVNFANGPAGKFFIELFREIGQLLGTVVVVGVNLTIKAFTLLFNVVDGVGRFIAGAVEKMTAGFDWLRKVTGGLINIILPVAPAYKAMATQVAASVTPMAETVVKGFNRSGNAIADVVKKTEKAKSAFDALKTSVNEAMSGLATPDERADKEFKARMKSLHDGLKAGIIDQRDFDEQVRRAREAYNDASFTPRTDKLSTAKDRDINTNDPKITANNYAQAMRDAADQARAHNREVFAETFSDGLRAAMRGDLGDFFANWWERVLTKQLDDVGGKLFDLISQVFSSTGGGSGGGIFKDIGSVISTIFGSSPKNANGGTYALKGGGPVDSKLFSSWVTPDEIIKIGQAEDFSGGAMTLHVEASPWFDVRAKNAAVPVAREYAGQAAQAGAQGGAALARTQTAKRERSWMP